MKNLGLFFVMAVSLGSMAMGQAGGVPAFGCNFDDGREITISPTANGFEWREGVFVAPVTRAQPTQDDPVVTYFGAWADPERLDVFVGWYAHGGSDIAVGTALLSRVSVNADGKLISATVGGHCDVEAKSE